MRESAVRFALFLVCAVSLYLSTSGASIPVSKVFAIAGAGAGMGGIVAVELMVAIASYKHRQAERSTGRLGE